MIAWLGGLSLSGSHWQRLLISPDPDLWHKMLESLGKLFHLHSDSKLPRTMKRDPLLQLIDSISTFDTQTFLCNMTQLAMRSPNPRAVQNRFMVKCLMHCKDIQASTISHEFILVELADTQRTSSEPLFIALERMLSPSHGRPSQTNFMEHPDSATVLKSVEQTLKEVPANLLASKSKSTESDPLSPYQAVTTDEFELTPSSPSPSYQLPFFDTVSLAATSATHTSTQSTSKFYRADDRFIGSKNLGLHKNLALNIRHICPQFLSLFDLAVLADAVHNHDPLYSIFKHQCFWFARIICDVVAREYTCTTITSKANFVAIDDVFIPRNSYLPNLEGRWIGFKISRVEEAISSVMSANFRKYLQEMENEVRFIFNLDFRLQKSRHR